MSALYFDAFSAHACLLYTYLRPFFYTRLRTFLLRSVEVRIRHLALCSPARCTLFWTVGFGSPPTPGFPFAGSRTFAFSRASSSNLSLFILFFFHLPERRLFSRRCVPPLLTSDRGHNQPALALGPTARQPFSLAMTVLSAVSSGAVSSLCPFLFFIVVKAFRSRHRLSDIS